MRSAPDDVTDPEALAAAEAIELVSINQARMQDLLTDVRTGDKAPAQLLAWGEVIDSAAHLWVALPQPPDVPSQTLLDRLQAMSSSLHDALLIDRWKSTHPDGQLVTVADTYTRAADVLRNVPVNTESAGRIRASVAASLHLGAHVIADTASRYAAGAAALSHAGASRHRRPNASIMAEAATRVRGMEQIAGAADGGLYAPRPPDTEATTDRALASVLARWEIQSHRSLVTRPSTMTMMLIAQTEAEIGRFAAAVLQSRAAVLGATDRVDLEQRMLTSIAGSVAGWRDMAMEWRTMLVGNAHLHVDPLLAAVSQTLRTVFTDLTGDVRGRADPDLALAFRIDVIRASSAVQDALAHTANLARTSRHLTLSPNHPFQGSPRRLAERAVELAGDQVAWVDLRALHRGHPLPLPQPVVDHVAATYTGIASHADQALNSSVSLHIPIRPIIGDVEPASLSKRPQRPPMAHPAPSSGPTR